MTLLALETSGLAGSIALEHDGRVVERELATAGRRHAQTLVAEIRELLREHGLRAGDVEAVGVSIGPGSFTGLRVGVVCAKTLAYATGCRVIAVDTLAAVAEQSPAGYERLWVIGDAQRGDFFAGQFRKWGRIWERKGEIRLVSGVPWCAERFRNDVICGPGTHRIAPEMTAATVIREGWAQHPTASGVLKIARRRLAAGSTDDPWTLSPLYIRPSAAEEKRMSS